MDHLVQLEKFWLDRSEEILPFHLTTVKPRDSEPEFFQVSLNRFLYKWQFKAQVKAV